VPHITCFTSTKVQIPAEEEAFDSAEQARARALPEPYQSLKRGLRESTCLLQRRRLIEEGSERGHVPDQRLTRALLEHYQRLKREHVPAAEEAFDRGGERVRARDCRH
jgi:ssDNA-binding replication factor A large subunit